MAVIATSKWGIGISSDTVSYFGIARSFADGHGFLLADGTPMTIWPPFFPASLAIGSWLGLDPATWSRIMNLTLYAALVVVCAWWSMQHYRSRIVAMSVAAAIATSASLLDVSTHAWSEPLFTLCTVASLMSLGAYLQRPSWRLLAAAAVLAGGAELSRYAGIPLLGMSVVLLLVVKGSTRWQDRLRATLIYGAIAGCGPLAWAIHNRIVSDSAAPPAYASAVSLRDNLTLLIQTIGGWFIPAPYDPVTAGVIGAAMLATLVAAVALLRSNEVSQAFIPMSGFVVAYALFLLIATSLFTANVPYARYLTPAVPAFAFSIGLVLDRARSYMGRGATALSAGAIAVCIVWAGASTVADTRLVQFKHDQGAGFFATDRWRTSRVLRGIRLKPLDGHVSSNFADVIRYLNKIEVEWAPSERPFAGSTTTTNPIPKLRRQLSDRSKPTYLIWFLVGTRGTYMPPEALQEHVQLKRVRRYSDADIYEISLRESPDEP